MKARFFQIVSLGLVAAIAYALWLAGRALWGAFSTLSPELGAALVTGSFTVIVSISAVVVGRYLEKTKEITEVYREKRQKVYEEFIEQFFKLAEGDKVTGDHLTPFLREFNKKTSLWSGPKTVRSYVGMMVRMSSNPTAAPSLFAFEDFLKAMRHDLGLSNTGLQRGDLLGLILRIDDLQRLLKASATNANVTLQEASGGTERA